MKLYHNPTCSKSRGAIDFLNEKGVDYEVIDIVEHPLSVEEIRNLLVKLNISVNDLVRTNTLIYKEKMEGKSLSEVEILEILSENPPLIQRPILEVGEKAIIARPLEIINDFL